MAGMYDILRWVLRWKGSGELQNTNAGQPTCDVILTDHRAHAVVPEPNHAVLRDVRGHAEAEEC